MSRYRSAESGMVEERGWRPAHVRMDGVVVEMDARPRRDSPQGVAMVYGPDGSLLGIYSADALILDRVDADYPEPPPKSWDEHNAGHAAKQTP